MTVDGHHRYVLFSVGDQSIACDPDEGALTHGQIFEFLWEQFLTQPKAAFVGFFLGYDFTQWLRSLPYGRAWALLSPKGMAMRRRVRSGANSTPFPVEIDEEWEIDLLVGKRLKLRKLGSKSWLYVCDAGPFFQSSFLTAIDPKKWTVPVCTPEEYEIIREGKEHRSDAKLDSDMVRYNVTENAVMSKLMTQVHLGLSDGCGVHLKKQQWYGPGQAAQAWLDSINAPQGQDITKAVPKYAMKAAQATYFGGWFEIFAHGHIPGESYEYDINSAYPAIIADLPCLLHSKWSKGEGYGPSTKYKLVYGTAIGQMDKLGTMLHRESAHTILRPARTRGWFWAHEIEAAIRAGAVLRFESRHHVVLQACDACPLPFAKIRHLYLKRLAVGKNSPQGKSLKLVYNSAYGKMAQSVGSPKYGCAIYASLITAGCRTLILDAVASHPNGIADLLMVATDGVYFATPHDNLNIDPEKLGAWDATTKRNMTLMKPGVYWDDKSREYIQEGLLPILKSRGISARDLGDVIPQLDEQWAAWEPHKPWPTLDIPIKFAMLTARAAVAMGRWEDAGRITSMTDTRVFDGNPEKKRNCVTVNRVSGRWETTVRKSDRLDSVPYAKEFGASYGDPLETPDGDMTDAIHDLFREKV